MPTWRTWLPHKSQDWHFIAGQYISQKPQDRLVSASRHILLLRNPGQTHHFEQKPKIDTSSLVSVCDKKFLEKTYHSLNNMLLEMIWQIHNCQIIYNSEITWQTHNCWVKRENSLVPVGKTKYYLRSARTVNSSSRPSVFLMTKW